MGRAVNGGIPWYPMVSHHMGIDGTSVTSVTSGGIVPGITPLVTTQPRNQSFSLRMQHPKPEIRNNKDL